MPKFLEERLRKAAAARGKTGEAADRYVYGAMNNMGAMHGSKETAKGRAMEKKHESDSHPNMKYRHTKHASDHPGMKYRG